MLKSMTGYGSASIDNEHLAVHVEVKTLNSKYLDANFRLPKLFSDKEIEVKNLAQKILVRGKVNLSLHYSSKGETASELVINKGLIKQYYQLFSDTAQMLDAPQTDVFKMVMKQEGVLLEQTDEDVLKLHWKAIHETIEKAFHDCERFRKDEGEVLAKHLKDYALQIGACLDKIAVIEPRRTQKIKVRLQTHMQEFLQNENFDKNRFEQEIIYYAEKLDITEEQTRLQSHIDYFLKELSNTKVSGKKLGFISQEMGREINTIGSKANDADMQRLVVEMKEELEKIKEQSLNVL